MGRGLLVTATLFTVVVLFEPHGALSTEPAAGELRITEKERTRLTEIANKKARELGFHPERSNFKITKEKNLFKADFWPKAKEGEIIYGGNLTLYLDVKGRVVRVEASP